MLIITFLIGGTAFAARVAGTKEIVTITTKTADTTKKVIKESPASPVTGVNQGASPTGKAFSPALDKAAAPAETPEVKTGSAFDPSKEVKTEDVISPPGSVKERKAPVESVKGGKRYVTIDFDNVEIGVLVKFVSELTGKNFIIDDKVKGKVTIISPKKIPVEDVYKVFLSVLEVNGFTVVPAGDMIKITPATAAREKSLETRTKNETGAPEDRMITQIVSLERANPDEVKRVLDPIISKSSSVLPYPPAGILIITDYLSNIKRLQEIISALDVEGAGDQISYLPLQNASASEVVKALSTIFQQRQTRTTAIKAVADSRTNSIILLASGADTENVRKLVAMMDKDVPRGESNIQVYRLQNSVAEDLAKVLNSIKDSGTAASTATAGAAGSPIGAQRTMAPVISKNVQVVPDKATNTLVIMAEREDYKVLENIIKQLDVPRAMVYIEALIMEVNTNKAFKLGVEWRGLRGTDDVLGAGTTDKAAAFIGSGGSGTTSNPGAYNILPNITYDAATGLASAAFPAGFSMGVIGAGIKIGDVIFPSIGAVVQAYKTDSEVSILSTPQIMTLDNEEAEINVGSNVPYITRQDSNSTTTTNVVNYNTYEYKDVGVILNITPHINEENFIRLKISQQVTKVTSGTDKGTPTTLKRTAKTTVVVKDKDTVVIGGLVGDSTEDNTYKVPLFGDIPLLGWLFKTKANAREKTNLYVFLTPHIVRTQKDAAALFQNKRETMGEVVEGVIKLNEKKTEANPLDTPAPAGSKMPAKP